MPFVCHLCVICVSFVCRSHFVYMSFVCALMPSVCHSYVLVWHLYVTRIYSYVTCMSLACTRMSPLCHSYVTRLWFPIYFQTKRLIKINVCEISFSNDIWFLSYVKLKFWWCLYPSCCHLWFVHLLLFTIFSLQLLQAISLIIVFLKKSWKFFSWYQSGQT